MKIQTIMLLLLSSCFSQVPVEVEYGTNSLKNQANTHKIDHEIVDDKIESHNLVENSEKSLSLEYSSPIGKKALRVSYNDDKSIIIDVPDNAVFSIEDGRVKYIGSDMEDFGNLIIIEHKNNTFSAYGYLDKILVSEGSQILRGQQIAETRELYFSLKKGDSRVDPRSFIDM